MEKAYDTWHFKQLMGGSAGQNYYCLENCLTQGHNSDITEKVSSISHSITFRGLGCNASSIRAMSKSKKTATTKCFRGIVPYIVK